MKVQTWLYFIVLFVLFSCGNGDEAPQFKIGFSQCVSNDAWRRTMHEEMFRELSFYPGLSLEIKDAQGNNNTQIQQIRAFMEAGIDLLIVSPNESAPITPIIEEVFHSGIPVIVVDRKTTSNLYSAYVGGDNYEVGYSAGQYIRNLLKGEGKIMEMWGLRGSSPAIERHRGLTSALSGTNIAIAESINGEWEKDTAKNRLRAHLLQEQSSDFDLIFGHNDVMAIGSYEVLKDLEITNKKFVGVDALPGPYGGIQAVSDGILDATFFYPTGGDKAIEVAFKILTGEKFDKENILQTAAVDSSNVRIMKQQTDKIIDQQANITKQNERISTQMEIYRNQRTFLFGFGFTLFVAILSLAYVFKSLREKQEINEELKSKNKEISEQKDKVLKLSKKAEEATQQKFEFFTNISHEFRTPLTLIQAPVEDLLQNHQTAPFKNDLTLIRNNTMRLLRLVNQLMDLRKIDHHKMKVKAVEQELIPFIEDIMSSFRKTAENHEITFKLITEDRSIKAWFDPMMLDKVMFNLLSNAFKFTSNKGSILIKVFTISLDNTVNIKVEDSGKGMSNASMERVFDRFYQGETFSKTGTGIGLALSKELIDLHKGEISVDSKEGIGTTFQVTLKLGKNHFKASEILEGTTQQYFSEENIGYFEEPESLEVQVKEGIKEQTILIIEDDEQIRNYLSHQLSKYYQVLEAKSVEIGLAKAMDEIPDLITCDLMLQHKNGFDIVRKLKNDLRTSHIPIIVISAKSGIEERILGIRLGVDDYIPKPFNFNMVLERIKMLLASRQKLREHYIHELPIENPKTKKTSPDKRFVSEFTSIVEKNFHNPHFGVNEICEEIGLSRGQLYRKVKALLGYSVNDYINKVRLKKAKHLLVNENSPIADIAFQVGFTTSAYFSTAFRNHFGITPSDFREHEKVN
ncbi:substrate-binding domain-containing protein [Echinicola sp. CAU 1574]|uniref:histidine kinase n=1 Tax=Echinicola arenosa TaxID=2774144 RepID=A0ABR9AEY5_9BACT|nr:substrate-binding domain-containing protein [Echinicola arenosa]MBD8487222.1 substrate-binding domain-containing protein [Echinicola arenosa]